MPANGVPAVRELAISVDEERIAIVCNLMRAARAAAVALYEDLGLLPGETVMVGDYSIRRQNFCPLPILKLEIADK